MFSYAFVLGSHPALSSVEIQTYAQRAGLDVTFSLRALPRALMVSSSRPLSCAEILRQLGGTQYILRLVGTVSSPSSDALLTALRDECARLPVLPPLLGISLLTTRKDITLRDLRAIGMGLKRALKRPGLRMVFPTSGPALSSAQLFFERFPEQGLATVLLDTGAAWDVGLVEAVQDIAAYARRDRERPGTNPGKGMLPPKVAQMLLNLSLVPPGGTVYDPFCGVGTIPMEALLCGHPVAASDGASSQVERTVRNLAWLQHTYRPAGGRPSAKTFTHDIARYPSPLPATSIAAVVTEGWLGPARRYFPTPFAAEQTFQQVKHLAAAMLQNVRPALRPQATVTFTIPAFRAGKRLLHAPFLAQVAEPKWGRNRVDSFPPAAYILEHLVPSDWEHPLFRESARGTLLYGRPAAVVLREIVRLRLR
jgi:tRNA G10  N-methylase Trm11